MLAVDISWKLSFRKCYPALTIVVSTGGTKALFSSLTIIHSKPRSHLGIEKKKKPRMFIVLLFYSDGQASVRKIAFIPYSFLNTFWVDSLDGLISQYFPQISACVPGMLICLQQYFSKDDFLDQEHRHHQGTCQKCNPSYIIPDLRSQQLRCGAQGPVFEHVFWMI